MLRRVERTAAIAAGVMALAALAIARGHPGPAIAVAGGWLLIEVAYRSIHSGVTSMIDGFLETAGAADARERRRSVAFAIVRIIGQYALLAVLAYVMIARLRLHPLGLMAGASSAVAAAAVEAGRFLVKR